MTTTWRCMLREEDEGGIVTHKEYAKTEQDMLIFKDQGYTCTPLERFDWTPFDVEALTEQVRQLQAELEEERNLRQELQEMDHWDSEEN